mgnify:CR=1 FL=1
MKLSIEEQKKFLFDRLKTEPLRKVEENKDDIKAFVQATKGEKISSYLINNAWNDDCDRNTKVFLVRDQKTKEIVFFFERHEREDDVEIKFNYVSFLR